MSNISMQDYFTYTLGFKQAQNILIQKKIHKVCFFVIWRHVYLTLTFDLDKGHNFILSFDLK